MSKNIFVGSLAWGTTSEGLEQAFAQYGVVTSAKVVSDRETGRSKGFGFVEMESGGDEAIAALNGADLDGRQIVVNEARPREERGGGRGGYGGGGGGGGRSGGGGGGGGGGRGGYGGGGGRDRY
ncbi:MAG: RNA-binding protein [Fuerstiella sp.]